MTVGFVVESVIVMMIFSPGNSVWLHAELTHADHDFIHVLTYLTHTERDFAPAFLFTLMEARWSKTFCVLPDDSTKDMRVRHSFLYMSNVADTIKDLLRLTKTQSLRWLYTNENIITNCIFHFCPLNPTHLTFKAAEKRKVRRRPVLLDIVLKGAFTVYSYSQIFEVGDLLHFLALHTDSLVGMTGTDLCL